MLNIIDAQWKDHLLSLDHLKQGIGLVGYGQKDPLVEYKKQSFDMFQEMLDRIDTTTIRSLFNLQVVSEQPPETLQQRRMARRPGFVKIHWTKPGRRAGRRRGRQSQDRRARSTQGRSQRALSLRIRKEIQEVSRHIGVKLM